MPPFITSYGGGLDPATGAYALSARLQSIMVSIINVGEFIGAVSSFLVGDHLGRKGSFLIAMACVVVGTILQLAHVSLGELLVGRLILGYAVGLISCVVPLYIADCAPPHLRGALVSMYQFCVGQGLLLGVIVDNGTHNRTDSGSYRIPMAVQLIFPLIVVPGLLTFVPESPRWLLSKFKGDKARSALARLHGNRPEIIEGEVAIIKGSIEADEATGRSSWREIFRWGPEGRKAYLGMALQALQQATGINFITGYGIVFFFQIGFKTAFLIQIGLYLIANPALWISQYLTDKLGRRTVIMISGVLTAAVLFVVGGCGLATDKGRSIEKLIVAMVYLFLVFFNLGWGPTVWVVTSEISTGKNRNKLMALSTGTNWLFNWLVSFTFPYLFDTTAANLGPKIGFLYGSLTLAATAWVYWFLPETAGRTLEEIHYMFEQGVPAREFKSTVIEQPTSMTLEDQKIAQAQVEEDIGVPQMHGQLGLA
ncbi:hypothetical protein LTR10_011812 [Elasticomyces elasticus]|uniref:Major facilitator superfamily (MFS) profile domain-containing protein n=1 Tax=Exophiala sideris TaxID=1016849 RepID=A0ABR0JDK8_9EURO|nr:hypothetical protein LTR10_011812 [Elasticomyces elasticus]KAK5031730.1 hypothetical protein LTS07_004350 [Exophiala sideris]KAK5040659.1 hypothetical protein LTR13_002959 [Exophiala sideris]KAK5062007.1 hypothetical protein LTR69_005191 [Exophiala sideris]KAK5184707.1 hypothetical protein LTR44_003382 [Eurotiomycetes sp. CCFEE 6388]